MIELSPTSALMLYLCMTLSVLFGVWGYSHWRSRREVILSSDKSLSICEYCLFAYLDESSKEVTKCPQCGSFNSKKVSDS